MIYVQIDSSCMAVRHVTAYCCAMFLSGYNFPRFISVLQDPKNMVRYRQYLRTRRVYTLCIAYTF